MLVLILLVAAAAAALWFLRPFSITMQIEQAGPAAPIPATNPVIVLDEVAPNMPPPPQEIVGIGAVIKRNADTGENMITGVVPNSPAAEAGLEGNFIIRKIDDAIVAGMKLPECVDLIRGPVGSKVRLELFDVDANEARTVELTRRKIQL